MKLLNSVARFWAVFSFSLIVAGLALAGRDSSGVYTAPSNSFNPAVTGASINPTDWNAILDDLEAALTDSITGPSSVTDGSIVLFDGTNGRKVKESTDGDLPALAGLSGTGIAVRSAADTWVQRQVADTGNGVSVSNGTGVSGNIGLSLNYNGLAALSSGFAPQTDKLPIHDGANKHVTVESLLGIGNAAPGYIANRYYTGVYNVSTSTLTTSANRLYFVPFEIRSRETWTEIGIEVTTAAAGNARLGIYRIDMSTGEAGDLVLDAGTVDTSTTGLKPITISQSLDIGFYALVAIFDATPTVRRGNSYHPWWIGSFSPSVAGLTSYKSVTYGTLPSSAAGSIIYTGGFAAPTVWLRIVP